MPRMTVAEFIARTLAKERVGFVAGIPGSGLMELLDALDHHGSVRLIQVRHEQVSALMALGYGKATGEPAVCVGTRSPGGTNLVMGVTAAHIESVPMLVITGQVPSKLQWKGAFEEAELDRIFRPITKWSIQANRPDRVPELLREALRHLWSGRPGPVHFSLPYDFAPVEIEAEVIEPSRYRPAHPPAPAPQAVEVAADLVREAKRPAIIAGGGVLMAKASNAVVELAELIGAPIVSTYQKKPVPDTLPLAMGPMGYAGSKAAAFCLKNSDLILAVGTRLWDRDTDGFSMQLNPGTRLIQVDVDPAVIGRNYHVECGIVGDARLTLVQLASLLRDSARPNPEWREACIEQRQQWHSRLEVLPSDQRPIGPWSVVRAIRAVLGPDDCLVTDSGSYIHYAMRYFAAPKAGVYFNPNSGSMGFGLPGAMGVQIARPGTRVIALAGDGGFLMTAQDLITAKREGLPVVSVVLNNGAYGSIATRQRAYYRGRLTLSQLTNPDFVELSRSFGVWAGRVEAPSELEPVLRTALQDGGPAVVEVISDDSAVASPLLDNWWG